MADPISGFKLAQSGVNLAPSSVPASKANAVQSGLKPSGKNSFKYPLKMMDGQTDFLLIKIYDYIPGGFAINAKQSPYVTTYTKDYQIGQVKNPKFYITLPIPSGISDSNSVTWGDDTINPVEAFGVATFQQGTTNPVNALQDAYKAALSGVKNVPQGTIDAIINSLGASAVNSAGGNVSASGLISRATGQVLNTNLELLFQGVNLRQFPFTFDFIPRDAGEGEEIKQIIRTLKQSMTPSNGGAPKGSGGGLFIKSPKIFQIEYRSGGKPHPFLNKFKPMALTDMTVNYTASGAYATYENATPVHMQMTLTFKEINPVYSEDYDDVGGVGY